MRLLKLILPFVVACNSGSAIGTPAKNHNIADKEARTKAVRGIPKTYIKDELHNYIIPGN